MSPRGRPSKRQLERRKQERPEPRIAETRTLRVEPAEAGQRIDKLLATRLPELSRARIQQLIEQADSGELESLLAELEQTSENDELESLLAELEQSLEDEATV